MVVQIDNEKFEIGHEAFTRYMMDKCNGVPFSNFEHPFLFDDEIAYKIKVYRKAKDVLCLNKWKRWVKTSGKIIQAVKEVCKPTVSENLLEHRYGFQNSSEAPLYRVNDLDQIKGLEAQLFDFFFGSSTTPTEFSTRFDALANYLRENHLGCKWSFLAYLAFLLSPQTYFPILPSRFDDLLHFYGIEESISGYVSWERYSILLELADVLKSKLNRYGQLKAIEIQSYMWVVSYLINDIENEQIPERKGVSVPDFSSELEERVQRARERERIGLLGEQLVYEIEKNRLKGVECSDLANRVRLVSSEGVNFGFDILSFNPDGSELHIEVKTTTRPSVDDDGFWLSETERRIANQDSGWVIYRVWDIGSSPNFENLGNIVLDENKNWEWNASSWYVRRNKDANVDNSKKPKRL